MSLNLEGPEDVGRLDGGGWRCGRWRGARCPGCRRRLRRADRSGQTGAGDDEACQREGEEVASPRFHEGCVGDPAQEVEAEDERHLESTGLAASASTRCPLARRCSTQSPSARLCAAGVRDRRSTSTRDRPNVSSSPLHPKAAGDMLHRLSEQGGPVRAKARVLPSLDPRPLHPSLISRDRTYGMTLPCRAETYEESRPLAPWAFKDAPAW